MHMPASWLGGGSLRVAANHHGVYDGDDLVHRQIGPLRMFANRLRTARLVDADRPDRSAALFEDIAPDPTDVVRHLVVSNLLRALRSRAQVLGRTPAAPPQDRVHL